MVYHTGIQSGLCVTTNLQPLQPSFVVSVEGSRNSRRRGEALTLAPDQPVRFAVLQSHVRKAKLFVEKTSRVVLVTAWRICFCVLLEVNMSKFAAAGVD
jgi:hypothetical protein